MRILKKIYSMLFEDLHWKLLSLAAAVVIWVVGMNMSNPYQNEAVVARLQLANLEVMARDRIVVLNEDELSDLNVTLTVRAPRSEMDRLRTTMLANPELFANMIEVSVDFRAVDSSVAQLADGISTQRLRVSPNLELGFEHLTINPPYIDVYLDTIALQTFPVEIVPQGVVSPGFELQQLQSSVMNVNATGSRTDIRRIGEVRATVDISGVHGDVVQTIPLQIFDVHGEDMTDRISLNISEVSINISVLQTQQVDVAVRWTGSPASGFALAGILGSVTSVEVVGSPSTLEEIDAIVAEINIAGANANFTHVIEIADLLPEGVTLRQGEITTMYATARIEPIESRDFVVPRDNISRRGLVELYQIVNDNVPIRVSVSGPRSMINALNPANIGLELDLRTLEMGVHAVPLTVVLPTGFNLSGPPPTLLVQIHESVSAENGNGELIVIPLPSPNGEYENGNGNDYPNEEYDNDQPQGADDEEYDNDDNEDPETDEDDDE
ncbi:MAG: CdaR family protein [Defluviitaleaceae bacterium]|nr:CdaR family protein [Defluviitaleaceae bacterium]